MLKLIAKSNNSVLIKGPFSFFLDNLGGESAFQVSLDAKAMSEVREVFPCHLGDVRELHLPESLRPTQIAHLNARHDGYSPAAGIPILREAIKAHLTSLLGIDLEPTDVTVTAAKAGISKLLMACKGIPTLIPQPGYPIYDSVAGAIGAKKSVYGFQPTIEGNTLSLSLQFDEVRKALKSINKARCLWIINDDHNPTGSTMTKQEIAEVRTICEENTNVIVCLDLAYLNIRFDDTTSHLSSLAQYLWNDGRLTGVWTFSKEGAATGDRMGAVFASPTLKTSVANKEVTVTEAITTLTSNFESCYPIPIQSAVAKSLTDGTLAESVAKNNRILQERRDELVTQLQAIDGIVCTNPSSTFYVWADITDWMSQLGYADLESCRLDVLEQTGVSFCTQSHFGMPESSSDRRYVRFAFSGITTADIRKGIQTLAQWTRHRLIARETLNGSRILVLGGGPVARLVASRLLQTTEANVTIISRHSQQVLVKHGLSIRTPIRTIENSVSVSPEPSSEEPVDFVVDCRQVGASVPQTLNQSTLEGVVCFQNGAEAGKVWQESGVDDVQRSVISVQIRQDEENLHGIRVPKEIGWEFGPVADAEVERYSWGDIFSGCGFSGSVDKNYESLQHAVLIKTIKNLGNLAALRVDRLSPKPQSASFEAGTYGSVLGQEPGVVAIRKQLINVIREVVGHIRSQDETFPMNQDEMVDAVLKYIDTDHIPTTVAAARKGMPLEDIYSDFFRFYPQSIQQNSDQQAETALGKLISEIC